MVFLCYSTKNCRGVWDAGGTYGNESDDGGVYVVVLSAMLIETHIPHARTQACEQRKPRS